MLSSNLLSILAIASFALTTTTAAALKPRADSSAESAESKSESKTCTNLLYSIPQCCVPDESGLAEPDCITRKLLDLGRKRGRVLCCLCFLPSLFLRDDC